MVTQAHDNMNLKDIKAIMELLEQIQPKTLLEIGVNRGCTAEQILNNFPSIEKYTAVDLSDDGRYSEYREGNAHIIPTVPAQRVLGNPRFHLILKPRGSFDCTAEELGKFDVVFVDGDHMLWGIMHDTGLAKRCATKLIIWHDYTDLEAKPYLDFMRSYLPIVHRVGTSVAFSKIS